MFEQLIRLLEGNNARFRVIQHPAEGNSEKVATVRGTAPGQGAKAMLCKVRGTPEIPVLAVLSGDRKLDFRKLAENFGGKKASLALPEEAEQLTGCVIGAIPPFSFSASIPLVVDTRLLECFDEIAFNAGRLDTSIVLNSEDYQRIARPILAEIASPG